MLVKGLILSSTIYACHETIERFLLVKSIAVWFSWRIDLYIYVRLFFLA
jgi:hypothetical protein